MQPKVLYCQITYADMFEGTYECVRRVAPYVDGCIIVVEEQRPFTDEQKQKLLEFGNVHLIERPFKESLPDFRNCYLTEAKRLKKENNWDSVYICVSDTDEFYCEELCKDLKKIVAQAEEQGITILGVNSHDMFEAHEWMDDIEKIKEIPSTPRVANYFKQLIFKLCCDNLRYEGVGTSQTVHETEYCPDHPWRPANLPKKYFYKHIKSCLWTWRNAIRNLWLGGGGKNVADTNPYWVELKELAKERGIDSWKDFESYIKGEVDEEFENFLIKCLDAPGTDWGVETREMSKFYFATHPDRITPEIEEKLKTPPKLTKEEEVKWYVQQCYREALGREPDEDGLNTYKKAILDGKLQKEMLPQVLKQSRERAEKFGSQLSRDTESVKVQIPVDVNVQLNEQIFREAMMKSETWNEVIKPRLDVGKFVLESIQDKEKFLEKFYKGEVKSEDVIKEEWR